MGNNIKICLTYNWEKGYKSTDTTLHLYVLCYHIYAYVYIIMFYVYTQKNTYTHIYQNLDLTI